MTRRGSGGVRGQEMKCWFCVIMRINSASPAARKDLKPQSERANRQSSCGLVANMRRGSWARHIYFTETTERMYVVYLLCNNTCTYKYSIIQTPRIQNLITEIIRVRTHCRPRFDRFVEIN